MINFSTFLTKAAIAFVGKLFVCANIFAAIYNKHV